MENPKQHDSSILAFKLLVHPENSNKSTPIADKVNGNRKDANVCCVRTSIGP